MKTTSKIIATVAATLVLASAGAVLAQSGFGPGMGNGPGMGMGYGPGMGMGMGSSAGMGPRGMGHGPGMGRGMGGPGFDTPAVTTARMAELKAQLKITSGQEAAWKAYEAAATQQAATMQSMHALMQSQLQGAPSGAGNPDFASQRLALMAQRDAARAASSAALRDLYAALTPEQRTLMGYGQFAGGPRR